MNINSEHIWYQFHKELKGFILRKVPNAADADDILQEAFLKIMQHIEKVNEASNIKAYLYGIVKNTITDYFRKNRQSAVELNDEIHFTEDELDDLNDKISVCCLEPFILLLPDIYKEALWHTEIENLSQKDLAQKLNISYSGAKSRVQRAKLKLKEVILEVFAMEHKVELTCSRSENSTC